MGIIAFKGLGKAFKLGKNKLGKKNTRGTPYKVEKAPAKSGQGKRTLKAKEQGKIPIKRRRSDGTSYVDYVQQNKKMDFTYKPKYPKNVKQGRLFGEKRYQGKKEEQLKLPFSETARKKLGIQQRKTERAEKKKLKGKK
jgi:hypothetical protein